jgi:hypothetical protein
MKNLLFCFAALFCTLSAAAQSPQAFNYQGIARDGSGAPIADRTISLRLTIQTGALPRSMVYQETHTVQTNKHGVFTTEVGRGHAQVGLVDDIEWGIDNHYIQVEMDPAGGTNFTLLGESELLSVPYALYAGKSAGGESLWQENARGIHYNDGNVGIGSDNPEHKLTLLSDDPSGEDRILATLKNASTSNRSWAAMRLAAGSSNTYTYLNHHASTYNYDGNKYTDFGQLSSTGKGLILRADRADGVIKFLAGGDPLSPTERMRITGKGFVGIGTENPEHTLSLQSNDPSGDGRILATLKNASTSNRSWAAMRLAAGSSNTYTYLNHHASTYNYDGNKYTDFGQLSSTGKGLILRADRADGVIKFLAGGDPLSPAERMRITGKGFVGIGTENPISKLTIEGNDPILEGRNYIRLYNKSLSNRSNVYISLSAGDDEHSTYLNHSSETYDLDGFSYANFGQLESRGGGLNLVASHTDGVLRFFTAHDLATNLPLERMRLSSEGNFGIGTKQPASKLQISHGDVYIEDINNGVIMKSPDGNCWRTTMNNDGTFKSTSIPCPN